MNALRHGLTARVVVLPSEDMAAYTAFSEEIVDSLNPQTPVERQFAQTAADNLWRLNRIRSIEDGLLAGNEAEAAVNPAAEDPALQSALDAARAFRHNSKALATLSIYEQRLHRAVKEALRELAERQTARRARRNLEMDHAIRLLKTQQMKGYSYNPQVDGFVYASAEIAAEARRRYRLRDAERAEQIHFSRSKYTEYGGSLENPYLQETA